MKDFAFGFFVCCATIVVIGVFALINYRIEYAHLTEMEFFIQFWDLCIGLIVSVIVAALSLKMYDQEKTKEQ